MALERIDVHNPAKEIQRNYDDHNFVRCSGDGLPTSGPAPYGSFAGYAGTGSIYTDINTGVEFCNEGTLASPYWSPLNYDHPRLMGWYEDFRNGLGKADADTGATATLVRSGLRIHGQGIAETDSGVTVTMSDQGAVADAHTTNEDAHTVVLSVGTGTTPVFQPDQNGPCVIDVVVAQKDDILLRAAFCGFCGSAADALDPIVTGSGTTISFAATVGDDVAGLYFDVGLTDGDRWFAPHDKANANASIATTATGVDTGVDVAAAGTYQRLRVEVGADGSVACFINKAQVARFAAATLDVDEEIHPVLYLENVDAGAPGVQSMLVKQYAAWGARV